MKLYDYQVRALEFVIAKEKCFLALDMGMGKTAISLSLIAETREPALVFGPLRTIYTSWPEEIKKWTPHLSYRILHGVDKSLKDIDDVDILLINYQGLKWLATQKQAWKRRTVIYDESSMCKSHSTQRFKLLRKMFPMWGHYAICLSATPAPNSLQELWAQYFLLDQGKRLGKNISAFRTRYCRSFSFPGMPITKYEVMPEARPKIYKAIEDITYRLDAQDYIKMPPIIYNEIRLKLPVPLASKYKELETEFFTQLDSADIEAPSAGAVAMKLRQFVQGGVYDEEQIWHELHTVKLNALKELVETSAGQPILCAIQFRGELKMIQKVFPNVIVIAGGTTAAQASEYINRWNSGDIDLLLCHPASLSHGVNLQSGGHVLLWYGLTWSLEQYIQLNGRLYRNGQKNGVVVHHLIMENSIDEAVLQALKSKNTGQRELLTHLKDYQKSIST